MCGIQAYLERICPEACESLHCVFFKVIYKSNRRKAICGKLLGLWTYVQVPAAPDYLGIFFFTCGFSHD